MFIEKLSTLNCKGIIKTHASCLQYKHLTVLAKVVIVFNYFNNLKITYLDH